MMKRRRLILMAAGLAAVAGVATLHAQNAEGRASRGRLAQLRSDVALTQEQRKQLREIVVAHRTEIADVARPLVDHRRALLDAILAGTTDEAAIRAAAEQIGKDLGDAAVLAAKLKSEVRPVLSDAQVKALGDFGDDLAGRVDAFLDRLDVGR